MTNHKDCCNWCGKSMTRSKNEEPCFCFCGEDHKQEYNQWLKNHEAKIDKGEFKRLSIFEKEY